MSASPVGMFTHCVSSSVAVEHLSQMTLATMMPVVFGDERDQVIKKFNQIQACWGVGKGIYNPSSPFVDFGDQYSKFKVCMHIHRRYV